MVLVQVAPPRRRRRAVDRVELAHELRRDDVPDGLRRLARAGTRVRKGAVVVVRGVVVGAAQRVLDVVALPVHDVVVGARRRLAAARRRRGRALVLADVLVRALVVGPARAARPVRARGLTKSCEGARYDRQNAGAEYESSSWTMHAAAAAIPAPPYSGSTVTPSSPSSPHLRKSAALNRSARLCSNACGSTSSVVNARTISRSAACSGVGSKREEGSSRDGGCAAGVRRQLRPRLAPLVLGGRSRPRGGARCLWTGSSAPSGL